MHCLIEVICNLAIPFFPSHLPDQAAAVGVTSLTLEAKK